MLKSNPQQEKKTRTYQEYITDNQRPFLGTAAKATVSSLKTKIQVKGQPMFDSCKAMPNIKIVQKKTL